MILSYIFWLLASITNSFMDTSSENEFPKPWWNKSKGLGNDENKWKWFVDEKGQTFKIIQKRRLWYYAWIYTPSYVEKFPLSSTLGVGFTDGWHLLQLFFLLFLKLCLLSPFLCYTFGWNNFLLPPSFILSGRYVVIEWFVHLTIIWGLGFESFYKLIIPKLISRWS